MINRFRQWFCIVRAKKPAQIVLYLICLINLAILLLTTAVILIIQHFRGSDANFLLQAYKTLLMMIGAIDINDVIDQTGTWDVHMVFSAIFYLVLVVATMVSFTGALIGYLANNISRFVERSNAGAHPLHLSEHLVILNWNSRAAEIVNDMLYKRRHERIVVMVQEGKESIQAEIRDRLSDTVRRENERLHLRCQHLSFLCRCKTLHACKFRNKLEIIVRQGDIYAAERLMDISVGQAKSIIILCGEHPHIREIGRGETHTRNAEHEDCSTVKLLMQVAEITGQETSRDNQQIVVEVHNEWTMGLVRHISHQKQKTGKSNIIAVPVNDILGDILAQVIVMPELNMVYNELFSYQGAEFFTGATTETDENSFVEKYLKTHVHALPLTVMDNHGMRSGYYIALNAEDIDRSCEDTSSPYTVELNEHFQMDEKSVIILGHSSKSQSLIEGLYAFDTEWKGQNERPLLDVVVIDDEEGHVQNNQYTFCPLIRKTAKADIYSKEIICGELEEILNGTRNNVSILILSDDTSDCDNTDRNVFTYLIYVQSVINEIEQRNPAFNRNRMDIIVELNNPKNADIIANYNVNYVIISNRYISRLFNHLGEKESLYCFLTDILTYDDMDLKTTKSKEIYIKRAGNFFRSLPEQATAQQLIRAIYEASPPENKTIAIGYISADKQMVLFAGDQRSYKLELKPDDDLIVLGNH